MKEKHLIIFGSQGTAAEIYEHVTTMEDMIFSHVEIVFINDTIFEHEAIKYIEENTHVQGYFIFGVVDYKWRRSALEQINEKPETLHPYSFIHATAFVAKSASIGDGSYIAPGVTVSVQAEIGRHAHINIGASIGHHAIVEENSVILPGARISGHVQIGARSLVGSNTVIFQGVSIGEDNVIDALTYLKKDTKHKMISFGYPAKTIRRITSY